MRMPVAAMGDPAEKVGFSISPRPTFFKQRSYNTNMETGTAMKTDANVLHLPIKGVWFNMIASGEKKEEYRDVKRYYIDRLRKKVPLTKNGGIDLVAHDAHDIWATEKFDILHLTAGYGHDKPQLWAEIKSITIGPGNPAWGAEPGVDYFVIKIGKITHTKNFVLQSEPSSGINV